MLLRFDLHLPVSVDSNLFLGEAVDAGDDAVLFLAHLAQGSALILSGKHGLRVAGAPGGLASREVEHAALHGHLDGRRLVRAVAEADGERYRRVQREGKEEKGNKYRE